MMETYPEELFRDLYWSFIEYPIKDEAEFKQTLRVYHKEHYVMGTYPKIKWKDKVLKCSKVVISYVLLPQRNGVLPLKKGEDIRECEMILEAKNGKYFTALELLHQIHNKIGSPILGERENRFFEGLTFAGSEDEDYPGIPVYFLDTGS